MATPSAQHDFGFLVSDVARLLRRDFERATVDSPLTLAQARALVLIGRNPGVRQVELAELLEVQPITLARLVDQLADTGLVERRPDPDDRRAYRVHLLPAAEPHLAHIRSVGTRLRARALAGLDAAQAQQLVAALRQVRENLTGA